MVTREFLSHMRALLQTEPYGFTIGLSRAQLLKPGQVCQRVHTTVVTVGEGG